MALENLSPPVTSYALTGVIEKGCEFEGKICFHGTLRINGVFKGEIFTPDTVVIGEDAKVFANIDAGVAIISGELNGNVQAKHRVEFHHPAIFRGEILTPSLSVDEGVIFEGSTKMVQGLPAAPSA